jgi:hypothetical protein
VLLGAGVDDMKNKRYPDSGLKKLQVSIHSKNKLLTLPVI